MKTIGLFGLFFGLAHLSTSGQTTCPPVIQWQKSFGTPSSEYASAVAQTRDGGFVIGGTSASYPVPGGNKTSPSYGQGDFWIIRTDANGLKLWEQSYGGDDNDSLDDLQPTSDGGFILGGTTWYESSGGNKTSTNYGNSDFWAVRTDGAGRKLWDRSFGGENFEFLLSVQQTADGGFVLAGSSSSPAGPTKTAPSFGFEDFWIVRLDGDGNRLWDRSFGGDGNDHPAVIRQLADGGFLVAGSSPGNRSRPGFGDFDYWIVRLDSAGNKIWDRIFGGPGRDELLSMVLTSDGGCVVGGWSWSLPFGNKTSPSYGYPDYWVLRLDANGNKVWERSYGGSDTDVLEGIAANSDGTFLLAGYSISMPGGSKTTPLIGDGFDYWLIRIAGNGEEIWQASFGGQSSDFCRAAAATSDGGYILAGSSTSVDGDRHGRAFGGDDFWLVKLTAETPDDCDHDGVPNGLDQCTDTPLGAIVNSAGCSISQICPCDTGSHGDYVACVRDAAKAFEQAGLIDNARRRQLIEEARVANCPPSATEEGIIFGLPHQAINGAELDFSPAWFNGLWVRPEASAPEGATYGVSVSLGEADSGLFIYPDGNQSNYGDSWFFDVKAYGRKGGQNDNRDLISSVVVTKPYYERYPVHVDLSPLAPETLTIQIISNRTVIAETVVAGSSASFQVNGYARLEPRGNPYWRMPDGSVGVLVEFTSPFVLSDGAYFSITIGGSDEEGFRGDQIYVRADRPRHTVRHINRIDAVAGGGVPSFEIVNERLGTFGHAHQALGAVSFDASGGRLQINALDVLGPEDFAAVLIEAPNAASRLELDFMPVTPTETSGALALYPAGIIDSAPLVFSEIRVRHLLDQLEFQCDFQVLFDPASSDTPAVRLEVLRNGRSAGSVIFSNAVALGTLSMKDSRLPEITGCLAIINSNGVPTIGLGLAQVATFTTPDGAELSGNHIRVAPLNAHQRVRSISALTIEMVQHQSITITGERSTLLPPALSAQSVARDLLLSWRDSTHLYSLEVAPFLSGPFMPLTNEIASVDDRNTLAFPISSSGSHFFRLAGPAD